MGMAHQSLEKKEEGLKWGEWVGVSLRFPIGGLGEPNIYHDSVVFYKKWGFYLETVWFCEELVGVSHRRGWWYLGHKSSASTVVMLTSEQYNTLII